jgi:hypothetical protein
VRRLSDTMIGGGTGCSGTSTNSPFSKWLLTNSQGIAATPKPLRISWMMAATDGEHAAST